MAVTLAQAKLNVQDDLQLGIIDEFAKSSFIMDNIPFDDCVSPTGGGATLTYGYTRLVTQPTAAFRSVNSEYTPNEVSKQRYTTDLKVFGGAFEIDRIIAGMGGIIDEVAWQANQKVKAASALFSDSIFSGSFLFESILSESALSESILSESEKFPFITCFRHSIPIGFFRISLDFIKIILLLRQFF